MSGIDVANDIYFLVSVQGVVLDGQGSNGESGNEKQWERTRLVNRDVGVFFTRCCARDND